MLESLIEYGATSFLFSIEGDVNPLNMIKLLNKYTDKKFYIMIDSGAFSAWNAGKVIDIDEYIELIKKAQDESKHKIFFVNLDVISQEKGKTATKEGIKKACEKGLENYFYLQKQGIDSVHVFHQFDDFKYLDIIRKECCKEHNYLGLSPANDQSLESRINWLKQVYYLIRNKHKTHLFGLTGKTALEQVPCYSADSSSHQLARKFGHVFNPGELMIKRKAVAINRKDCRIFIDVKDNENEALKYYVALEKYITRLWQKRGIVFDD